MHEFPSWKRKRKRKRKMNNQSLTARLRNPSACTALWWTKTSFDPSFGMIKPKPFLGSNHFTIPVCFSSPPSSDDRWRRPMKRVNAKFLLEVVCVNNDFGALRQFFASKRNIVNPEGGEAIWRCYVFPEVGYFAGVSLWINREIWSGVFYSETRSMEDLQTFFWSWCTLFLLNHCVQYVT